MTITINADATVASINEEFNLLFPFLKLQFFKKPHKIDEPSSKKEMYAYNVIIGKLQNNRKSGTIELTPLTLVAELEELFKDHFDLNAQVFRNSGKLWLETSGTDSYSLKALNELGKANSLPLQKQDLTDIDYD
jgi:hypothetical protein